MQTVTYADLSINDVSQQNAALSGKQANFKFISTFSW